MIEEILPRLNRVRVPLSGNPLREVNSWVLTSADRNLVIDTGLNHPECRQVLEAGLEEIGVDLRRTDFVATHYHSDHHGLIATLLREGSRAFMGEVDAEALTGDFESWVRAGPLGRYMIQSGFPAGEMRASLNEHPGRKYGSPAVVEYVPLREGDTLRVGDRCLEVVLTPGHTDGHICLHEPSEKLLFSGDHVLGDITPTIQAWSDDQDPLALYVASLERVGELEVELCLPGHRSIITDFRGRIEEIIEHHRVRADEVISVLRSGSKNAYRTASQMSWNVQAPSWDEIPIMQRWFATGEAIAHLRYLEEKGLVERQLVDGQILFSTDGRSGI